MGSGSSKPRSQTLPQPSIPPHLAPRPSFIPYSKYRVQPSFPRSACVAFGNPRLADRHPERLSLLMLYDTRFAWRDLSLAEYRAQVRNVFPGDTEMRWWIDSDACKLRLTCGRDYIDRRMKSHGKGTAIPFLGDPMYGVYVDAHKVLRNLEDVFARKGFRVQART